MADTPLGKMIIEMGFDDSSFSKGITGVNKQLAALKNDLKTSQTSFSTFGKGVDGVRSPMEVLNKSIAKQKEQLDLLKKSYSGSLVDGKATSSTQNYANQISRANAQLAQYQAQLKNAAIEQYKQTSILPKLSSGFEKISGGLDTVSRKTAPVTVGITAAFAKGIQAATNFNGKMTEIQALLSDGTPANVLSKQMDTLSDKSKQWARQYGIDTSSINDGMEEMIKRGYDFNQTVGAMPAVLDASRASGEDFGTVMSASTAILEQFGLKTEDTASMMKNTQRVTDSLTFVANKTSAGFEDMGVAMEYVGPVANSLGMSLEETSSAIGLLSNNGIEGEKAGTSLRGALSRLLKPTKQSSAAFEELGINLEEWKKGNIGLPDMLDTIKKSTEGMTQAEKSSLIAKAFGTEAQTGMNILIDQGGNALRNLTKETQNATGYTKKLADQMNNSDKNAFNKAKATLEVLSIDLGQKLLPSIIPVVKEIDNLAGSFSKLSPETQQFIIKMAIAAAAVAPTAKALSGLTSIISGVTGGLARIGAKGAGELALRGIATEAGGATAAIAGGGGLSASLAGISPILAGLSPVAVGALGVAGLAGLIIGVSKAVDEAKDRVKFFGQVEVPKETVDKIDDFRDRIDKAKVAMEEFGTGSQNSAQKVKDAINSLAEGTKGDIDKSTKELEDAMKRTGYTADQIAEMKKRGESAKSVVEAAANDISQVYINANKRDEKNRALTVDEQARVSSNMKVIFESEADALKITGDKKNTLMKALNGEFNNMSKSQAQQVINDMRGMREQANKEYDQQAADQKKLLDGHIITQDTYNENMAAAEQERVDKLSKYGVAVAKAEDVIRGNLKLGEAGYKEWRENAEAEMGLYGESFDEALAKAGDASKKLGDNGKLLAKYTTGMSDDAKKANDAWNSIIFDPKTGEIKTNAPEAIAEAVKSKEGWDNMQFILKNANLTTNARFTVAEALIASGQWDQLSPEQKNLVVNNQQGLLAITDSRQNMKIWNEMPDSVKKILGDNKDFLQNKETAQQALTGWNTLPAQTKKLLGDDTDFLSKKGNAAQALNTWNSMPENVKKLLGNDTDFQNKKGAAASALKAWDAMPENVKKMLANNFDVLAKKEGATNAILQWNNLPTNTKKLLASNQTSEGVNSANAWIENNFRGKTANLLANSQPAIDTLNSFLNLPAAKTVQIVASTTKNAQGTPYHPGGLAMVNDQKGPTYKELISLPNGVSFIPEGRDVTMPLPKGTKILKASKTAQLIPKYADGTDGIPANAKIFRDMRAVQQQLVVNTPVVNNSGQLNVIIELLKLMSGSNNESLIKAIQSLANRPVNAVFDKDEAARALTPSITKQQSINQSIDNIVNGRRN
ncbi:phage tail tape measure protein [Lactococcus lactis]|uniref:phage tail tape measure protein n=1 Tax=Lactococcus lactis TaxID=1358 RepID=UPI00034AEFEF|nr:phage tail tape measure protein [Lactococcus lactis]ATY87905.1 phage tail tape measure protein [Lactococcus lactis subsp. lactis]ATZ01459.1 phage tail tape measure protein [Lactococcus lactis subsp. lactis]QOK49275.1 phage tail tape measure protein [Lactococcus lactis]